MTFLDIIRIFLRNWKLLLLFPLTVATTVYVFTIGVKRDYITSTLIYTGLASGYDITAEENSRIDFFEVNNAFDNLISTVNSRETIEETALKLMALNLHKREPSRAELSEASFKELHELISPELAQQVIGATVGETYQNLALFRKATLKNPFTDILDASAGDYSINGIRSHLKAVRKNSSDMLELTFTSSDPAIAQHTLNILIDVFISRYKKVKNKETKDVVIWYQDRLDSALFNLEQAEDAVKDFSVEHKLINYYEQTKFLAEAHLETEAEKEKTRQRIAGSQTGLHQLEGQIDSKQQVYGLNQDLADIKKELSTLNYRVSNAEILDTDKGAIVSQKAKIAELEEKLKMRLGELHQYETNPTGIEREKILKEWLDKELTNKGASSELKVIDSRLESLDAKYGAYAPLGATLARLERQVAIFEKEYLSYLNGLNMAKLKQQNIELANTLSTVDQPFFPLKPQPSKRMLMVLISLIGSFFLVFGFFIAAHLLDNTIKNSATAKKLTGREVLGVIPNFLTLAKEFNPTELRDQLFGQIHGSMSLQFIEIKAMEKRPKYIHLCSFRAFEGKTWFGFNFAYYLSELGYKVGLFYPDSNITAIENDPYLREILHKFDLYYYTEEQNFVYQKSITASAHKPFDESQYDYVFTCLPNISERQLPVEALKSSDMVLLLVNAARVWTPSDTILNNLVGRVSTAKPFVMLNKVSIDYLESIYGEFPRKRSALRAFLREKLNKLIS